ncbi:MAG: hypothetical protein H7Y07_00630 [Pyrinomonadaceae bacterium]|nr:hypothetical protein [Sphingobacteriaceae bacterium]
MGDENISRRGFEGNSLRVIDCHAKGIEGSVTNEGQKELQTLMPGCYDRFVILNEVKDLQHSSNELTTATAPSFSCLRRLQILRCTQDDKTLVAI